MIATSSSGSVWHVRQFVPGRFTQLRKPGWASVRSNGRPMPAHATELRRAADIAAMAGDYADVAARAQCVALGWVGPDGSSHATATARQWATSKLGTSGRAEESRQPAVVDG